MTLSRKKMHPCGFAVRVFATTDTVLGSPSMSSSVVPGLQGSCGDSVSPLRTNQGVFPPLLIRCIPSSRGDLSEVGGERIRRSL